MSAASWAGIMIKGNMFEPPAIPPVWLVTVRVRNQGVAQQLLEEALASGHTIEAHAQIEGKEQ